MRFRADTRQHPPPLHVELGPFAHIAPKRSCSKRPQLEPSVRRRGGEAWQGPKPRSCKQPGVGLEIRASKPGKEKEISEPSPQNPNPKLPKSEGSARAGRKLGRCLCQGSQVEESSTGCKVAISGVQENFTSEPSASALHLAWRLRPSPPKPGPDMGLPNLGSTFLILLGSFF